jgi:hypothetical protein
MTKKFKKDLIAKGYKNPKVICRRLDTHSIAYDVYFDEVDEHKVWDGHYFVGEVGTGNSKDFMLEEWKRFLNAL